MTQQDALAAALSDVLGDVQAASHIYARTVIDRLARDGWVMVNAETLAGALTCLIGQHRSVVSEWSGNFGGHVAIRDGWVDWDEDTVTEECPVCEVIAALRGDTDA